MNPGRDVLMREKFAAVELAQARVDLLPEPSIVIKIVFDKLLDVLIRAAPVLRRHAVKPRLQFRGEVYFHRFRVWKTGPGVKFHVGRKKNLPGRFEPKEARGKSISRLQACWRVPLLDHL